MYVCISVCVYDVVMYVFIYSEMGGLLRFVCELFPLLSSSHYLIKGLGAVCYIKMINPC